MNKRFIRKMLKLNGGFYADKDNLYFTNDYIWNDPLFHEMRDKVKRDPKKASKWSRAYIRFMEEARNNPDKVMEFDPGYWWNIVKEEDRKQRKYQSNKKPIPSHLRWEVWERDNFTCLNCGTRRRLSVDHIIPESSGGETKIENLQTLCKSCNSKKGSKQCQ